jgi:hypothetical protein
MKITIPLCSLLLLSSLLSLQGQHDEHVHAYDHHFKHNEVAFGTGAVYMPEESIWGYGIHLHLISGITEWMGAGLGYEMNFGDHTHYTFTGLFHFHPIHPLDINVGPGLVLPDKEHSGYRFNLHAEIAAVFELSEHFHIGPSIDTGIGTQDLHVTLGIHAGWVFRWKSAPDSVQ